MVVETISRYLLVFSKLKYLSWLLSNVRKTVGDEVEGWSQNGEENRRNE